MSLIHWDKSVLSFHLKEMIEDGHGNNPLALAGLGAIAASSFLVPAVTKLGRPFLKTAIKNTLFLDREGTSSELAKIWKQAAIASQNQNQLS